MTIASSSSSSRARRSTRCGTRSSSRARAGRRLHAVLLVHRRDRHVPRRRGTSPRSGRRGGRNASPSSGSRRLPGRAQDAVVAALREAHPYEEPAFEIYDLVAPDEGAALHRRRRARQSRPGRVRVRPRGGGRYGARGPRRGDRRRDEQRRGVPRPRRRPREGGRAAGRELEVVSDSELMVKQMQGIYRVKNEALRELSLEAARHAARSARSRTRRCGESTTSSPTSSSTTRWTPSASSARLPSHADVAQLARASACHAEGRGFESHHPLLEPAGNGGFSIPASGRSAGRAVGAGSRRGC